MRKLFILAFLSASPSAAQCTLFDQTGCSLIYTEPANPSLATYLSEVETVFQYTSASDWHAVMRGDRHSPCRADFLPACPRPSLSGTGLS